MDVLLAVVRDRFSGAETVPAANDQHMPSTAAAVQLLDDAAMSTTTAEDPQL
jgi:hypothetical protein